MSPSHFSRIFKKVIGLPYQDYLNGRRITKAKNLFRTSTRSVTEIAVFLVFVDPTGLARIFYRSLPEIPRQKAFFA